MMATIRNPDWNTDELILALDLYLSAKPRDVQKNSTEVQQLSAVLNQLHVQLGTPGSVTLRNPAGVYMKLQNFKAHDPAYLSRGHQGLKAGNKLEKTVWTQYSSDPAQLHQVARSIRGFIDSGIVATGGDLETDDEELAPEGRLLTRVHKSYERHRKNRDRKIADFRKANHGRVFCECCGFDFEKVYGPRGAGFIECHHEVAVSSLTPGQRLKLSDLRLVCANCHRMVHRAQPWLATTAVSEMVRGQRPF